MWPIWADTSFSLVQNVSAGFCSQCSDVHEHGGYTLGGIPTRQHCPRESTRTRSLCMVASWRYCGGSIPAVRIFTAKKSWVVLSLGKMFGSLNPWFSLPSYSLITFLLEKITPGMILIFLSHGTRKLFLCGSKSYRRKPWRGA